MLNQLQGCSFGISYGPGDDRLHRFYIPALRACVRYDRMTGYFTSSALAVAAAGVAQLIAGGGQMRLLLGAQLSPADVQAIREGHDLRQVIAANLNRVLPDPRILEDQLMQDRLAALAWMVAAGSLEIRVVLPYDADPTCSQAVLELTETPVRPADIPIQPEARGASSEA